MEQLKENKKIQYSRIWQQFYQNLTCNSDETLVYKSMLAVLVLAGVYFFINIFGFDYSYAPYYSPELFRLSPFAIVMFLLVIYCRKHVPRVFSIIWMLTTYYMIYMVAALLATSIQTSPFPYIDSTLIAVDRWLGFSTVAAMHFTYTHYDLRIILELAYDSLPFQMFFLVYIVGMYPKQRRHVLIYFFSVCATIIVGLSIYFFFPTVAPAHLIHSPYFTKAQHNTYMKFFDIHHYLPVKNLSGGMVAFPSFHVIWVLLITYLCRGVRWLFVPVALWNCIVIASTVMLGWHYLTDVIAAFIIVATVLFIAEKLIKEPSYCSFSGK